MARIQTDALSDRSCRDRQTSNLGINPDESCRWVAQSTPIYEASPHFLSVQRACKLETQGQASNVDVGKERRDRSALLLRRWLGLLLQAYIARLIVIS